MPSSSPPWKLENFIERFEAWVQRDSPEDDLRLIVTDWITTRYSTPYQGVDRQVGFDNLWYGHIPNSGDGCGNVVTCSYWIRESSHTVYCNDFSVLSYPA